MTRVKRFRPVTQVASKDKLSAGILSQHGYLSDDAIDQAIKAIEYLNSSDVETVRVLFSDQHGILRGKTIVAGAFHSLFTNGLCVPSTLLLKDTSHRTVFPVWSEQSDAGQGHLQGAGDILLVPDTTTLHTLPWSKHSAWILCDPVYKTGADIPFAPRPLLKTAINNLAAQGLDLVVGLEVEFHVFELIDAQREHTQTTMPGQAPRTRALAHGYQFLTETRYAELENVMDELRRYCQQLGLPIRTMEIEMGPSQFEFTFDPATPLEHADNMVMFRTMVKEVCALRGLHATFMCRPKVENGASSGWHLHQSLLDRKTGQNTFVPEAGDQLTPLASQWIAGLLEHARESCLLTTPTINGYKRYQPYQLAPDRIQWGRDNRGTMLRALLNAGDNASRIENRVADTTANPYYFFASQIIGGLSGINQALSAPAPAEKPYDNEAEELPGNMLEAIEAFDQSPLFRQALGDEFVDYLTHIKMAEWQRYLAELSDWEQNEYFSLF